MAMPSSARQAPFGALAAALCQLLVLAACGGGGTGPAPPPPPPPPPPTPASITISAGDAQVADAGTAVPIPPAVVVRNAQGQPMTGVTVQFAVAEGDGAVTGGSPATDASGVARVTSWTLGPMGTQRLSATVGALAPVSFQATIVPGSEEIAVTLGTGGGSYEITIPGHPYQGLKLTVPAGTYPGNAEVQLRAAPNAPLPAMPAGYRVSGPAIEVYTPQLRGAKLMTLDIPITRAANEDVLIAFYDPARRIIEVLPTVGRTATSVRVMTGHLRADLLVGRLRPAAAPSAGPPPVDLVFPNGPTGYLLQIALSLPIQPVAPVLNPATDRWPVIDHGSTHFPTGHGPAIPGLVGLGAALSAGLSQKVIPLPRPGFYADAAPLAAMVESRRLLSGLTQMINQLNQELATVPTKALRDEMVHHNLLGGMGISGSSSIAALMPALGLEPVFVNTVSGTETTIRAINPAETPIVQINRALAQGFNSLSVLLAGDQPPVTVDAVIPLPSFVFPGETLNTMFGGMLTVLSAPLGSQQREAGNLDLSTFVGLPTGGMDLLPFLGSPWRPTSDGVPIVIRGGSAGLRRASPFSPPGFLMNSLPGLAEVGSVAPSGGFLSTAFLADLLAAPNLAQLQYLITPTGTGPGGIKQTGSFIITLVKAPFKVTPLTVELPADLKVDFVAEVPSPPAGGFRIKWDWADGTPPTETQGTLTATHTYAVPADYAVRVTLQENTAGRESLAEIVVPVTAPAAEEPEFRGLGFLAGGSTSSATAVSPDGNFVVGSGGQAFRWRRQGGMSGIFAGTAHSVSNEGEVVVGVSGGRAVRWTAAGGMQDLGSLDGSAGQSTAYGVSADGTVIVGEARRATDPGGWTEPFRWTAAGGMQGLGVLGGFQVTQRGQALAVSADGSVIVGSTTSSSYSREGFRRINNGGLQGLGVIAPQASTGTGASAALGVSADGSRIVGFSTTAGGVFAVLWNGGPVVLGTQPMVATGITADGSLIIGQSSVNSFDGFLWKASSGWKNLATALQQDYGLNLLGWTLLQPLAISPDGRVMVGRGMNPQGQIEAWRAVLFKAPPPAP